MGQIEWNKLNATTFPLVEPGFYLVEIKDWEKTTASTGTEQVRFKAVTLEDMEGVPAGTPVVDHLALSEAALWRLGAFMGACGLDLKSLPNMTIGSEEFYRVIALAKGRKMWWEITQETYKDRTLNKVKSYMPYEDQEALEYTDNVPSFIKNKAGEPDAATKAKLKKAGLI